MKNTILWILLCLLLLSRSSPTQAQTIVTEITGLPIEGHDILATEVFACDGIYHPRDWIAPTSLRVYASQIWLGMTMGGVGDFFYILKVRETNSILNEGSWDHYTEPSSLNSQLDKNNFTPNYILVLRGQTIRLNGACTALQTASAQLSAVIWYSVP